MALPAPLTFDLLNTYVHLEAGGNTVPEEVGDDFGTKIAARPYEGMRLVCALRMTADSPSRSGIRPAMRSYCRDLPAPFGDRLRVRRMSRELVS